MMPEDPVVEEVRRAGAKFAEECGGDIHRMAERLREAQEKSGHKIIRRAIRPSPRRVPPSPSPDCTSD